MNLEDLIDENGVQQDEWSLGKPVFGGDDQLQVVGWSGQTNGGKGNKLYITKCSVCEQDRGLFGQGYFKSTKGHLEAKKLPCGCSPAAKFNREQWLIRIKRVCSESGFTLVSHEDFKGGSTRGVFSCPVHGETGSKTFRDFFNGGRRCIECRRDNTTKALRIPDEQHITEFNLTGSYPEGSKFERSDRVVDRPRYRDGVKPYWWFTCGKCGGKFERSHGDLKAGKLPCSCGHYRQTLAYIHLVSDGGVGKFLKFGITRPFGSSRLRSISLGTLYEVKNVGEWEFTECSECKKAESQVKTVLDCGVVSKLEFKSGWTETTSLSNLEAIIRIFEDHGGIRVWR